MKPSPHLLTERQRLGRVQYDGVITLDWNDVVRLLRELTDVRDDWSRVYDTVRKTTIKLTSHGVIPYNTSQKIHNRLDSTDRLIRTVLNLLQHFEQWSTTPKQPTRKHKTLDIKSTLTLK